MPRVGSKKFWIQTHLRNQRHANTVNIRLMKYEDRYKRLWSIYHHLWDQYCETAEVMTEQEYEKFLTLNADFDSFDKILVANDDYTQAGLSKMATKLKRFAMFVLNAAIRYGVLEPDTKIEYIAKDKALLVNDEVFYYFGN